MRYKTAVIMGGRQHPSLALFRELVGSIDDIRKSLTPYVEDPEGAEQAQTRIRQLCRDILDMPPAQHAAHLAALAEDRGRQTQRLAALVSLAHARNHGG